MEALIIHIQVLEIFLLLILYFGTFSLTWDTFIFGLRDSNVVERTDLESSDRAEPSQLDLEATGVAVPPAPVFSELSLTFQ